MGSHPRLPTPVNVGRVGAIIAVLAAIVAPVVATLWVSTPDVSDVQERVAAVTREHGVVVLRPDQVPDLLAKAVVAPEDSRFYTRHGLRPLRRDRGSMRVLQDVARQPHAGAVRAAGRRHAGAVRLRPDGQPFSRRAETHRCAAGHGRRALHHGRASRGGGTGAGAFYWQPWGLLTSPPGPAVRPPRQRGGARRPRPSLRSRRTRARSTSASA